VYFHEYGHIAILVIVALIFPLGAVVTSWAFQFINIRPKVPSDPVKEDIYECGILTEGSSHPQFNFRFYYVALLFVILDVELVFLFPWAVIYDTVGWMGFAKGMLFIGIFLVGGLYAWRKGALEWR
jgi:NADH-quinone oxidoreductase subunit A